MKHFITTLTLVAALLVPATLTAQHRAANAGMRLAQFKAPATAPALADEEPIMDAPEGTLHDNMYASSYAYGLGWGDVYIQNVDGGIGKVVEGTDGNLYIYNPISQGYIWRSRKLFPSALSLLAMPPNTSLNASSEEPSLRSSSTPSPWPGHCSRPNWYLV